MTAISIASAQVDPVLHFAFLTSWFFGIYKLLSLLDRFYNCKMQGPGNLWPKGYICLLGFICLFILYPANFIKALGILCNNHRQCGGKICIYKAQHNSKINKKKTFRPYKNLKVDTVFGSGMR